MASSYEADGRKVFTGCDKVIINELNQQNLKYSICDWRKLNNLVKMFNNVNDKMES